jgi:5-methylthioadenosine/S-adenosylhomocysteine deaminase
MTDLLIRGCDLLQLRDAQVTTMSRVDIAIRGNIIADIRPEGKIRPSAQTETIEARGLLAIPGLINTHAHVPMVLFRGLAEDVTLEAWFNDYIWPLESNLTPEDVYWGALLGLAEMIEAGITSVADHYFFMNQVAQAVSDSGMRAALAWAVFEHEGETKLDQTCDFVQRWQGAADGRITTWLGPHAPYTTGPDFLRLSAERAKNLNVGIHIHVSETAEQVAHSLEQYGITPVQMLAENGVLDVPTILGHCLYPTDDDIKLLQQAQTGIAHAPKTYLKLGMGTAPLEKFRAAEISVGLATDGVVSSNTLDILEQMRLMALTQKDAARNSTVMTVHDTLQIAFEGGADVMQMENRLGRIAPGALADITLLRQDGLHTFPRFDAAANLIYSSRSADVHTVICDGRLLLQDGRLLTIDKEQVKREVSARLARLSRRVPNTRIATYAVSKGAN